MKNIDIFREELRKVNKRKEHDLILKKVKKLETQRLKLMIELEKLQYL